MTYGDGDAIDPSVISTIRQVWTQCTTMLTPYDVTSYGVNSDASRPGMLQCTQAADGCVSLCASTHVHTRAHTYTRACTLLASCKARLG